jgi:uncharacterized membrane protein
MGTSKAAGTTTIPTSTGNGAAKRPDRNSGLYRFATRIEKKEELDAASERIAAALPTALRTGPLRHVLGGRWLGHALHPLLTDFPLGAWTAVSVLDLWPGADHDEASQRLLAFGLLATIPTVASGWSDWLQADARERRVGVVHAATNGAAALLYIFSLLARRAGAHRTGVALGIAGGCTATAGGFLGGHLSTARNTALRATADARA